MICLKTQAGQSGMVNVCSGYSGSGLQACDSNMGRCLVIETRRDPLKEKCEDKKKKEKCLKKARKQKCQKKPRRMAKKCAFTCDFCPASLQPGRAREGMVGGRGVSPPMGAETERCHILRECSV